MSITVAPKLKRRWRPWKVVLGLFMTLVLGFFFALWYQESVYEARLRRAIEATEKDDPFWRRGDLIAAYEKLPSSRYFGPELLTWHGYRGWFGDDIPYRQGAIAYDLEGADITVRFPPAYFKILKERLKITDSTGPAVMREQLRLLATEKGERKVAFDHNEMVQQARAVANYLRDEMELAAHEGRYADLIPLLRSQLQLADYCLAGPRAINHLVGLALRRQGHMGVARALAIGTPPAEVLLQLQQLLESHPLSRSEYILRTARAEYMDDIEKAANDPVKYQELKTSITSYMLPGSPSWQQRVDYFWKWLEVEDSMRTLTLAKAEILESSLTAQAQTREKTNGFLIIDTSVLPLHSPHLLKSVKNLIARQFVKILYKLLVADAASRAEVSSLIVALACERYRLATGSWPSKLANLQPVYLKEVPLDPFTGDSLLFRTLPEGIVIYSVGINRIDDGGDVLYMLASPKDRGAKLFNPEQRGKKFEDVHPDRVKQE